MPVKWTREQLADVARLQEQHKQAKKAAPGKAATKAHKPSRVAPKLKPTDPLPEAVVTRMWKAGQSLTEIAQKIGTGTRPNGTGYRVGRIRALLAKAGLYPRKSGK
jgi:hypothetical protein